MSEYHLWSLAIYWPHCSYTIYSLFCWTSKHKLSDTHIYFNWSHWNWAKIIAIKIHAYAHCIVFIYGCRADIFFSTGFLHFLSKICGFIWSSHLFTINNQSRCLWMFCLFVCHYYSWFSIDLRLCLKYSAFFCVNYIDFLEKILTFV